MRKHQKAMRVQDLFSPKAIIFLSSNGKIKKILLDNLKYKKKVAEV